ncbi:MAG: biotin--[acetyl-CoA-carboxylase] ligase [Firmicutes bacterium]|nr:biotin--[acetyl-CoA-carboxylase] ligase [Bacillota bacterium]
MMPATLKNRLLELFEQHRGETLSGETLASIFGVSRNAVWKAVCELKNDGYRIDAATHRGYNFLDTNDILSEQGIRPHLKPFAAEAQISVLPTAESTNKTAREAAASGAEHGSVIFAHRQTAGKGRNGREFVSADGGIYMSFVLRPEFLPFMAPTAVTALAAVAVCEAVESVTGKSPSIKWVNDVFLGGLKVCGISTEAVTDFESGKISWIVLGLGINYDTKEFPEHLRGVAGSIFGKEGAPAVKNRLAAEVINRILAPKKDEPEIFASYKKRLNMLKKTVTVYAGNEVFEAFTWDIDECGHLIVKKADGETRVLNAGEISVRG